MSHILQAGFKRFKQNKLGLSCCILFLCVFLLSLAAELIANDKPLLLKYDQTLYFPVLKHYPETTFGGVFETETEYKDPVVQQLIQAKGWAIWPLIQYSYQTPNLDLTVPVPSPPSMQNRLGTDYQGRDVLARVLYGLRVSLLFGFILTFSSAVLGIVIGAIQGYYGGWVDLIGQRILEVWGGLPMLFMVMILVSMFSPKSAMTLISRLLFFNGALAWILHRERTGYN